ncbi:MAG: Gfo/Idh/MocA family oxidoreductase [Oscillospiraceae bacterium]|jgi:predicted dehydrogenase|nr:Gfo/Idh/MocA family oxidoreductase [Oscillospiraceae bacterium]
MIPYAIVGTSWISEEFFLASLRSGLGLAGVCSRSREKGLAFAEKIGRADVPVYPSVEELAAAPGIRAVYVASPNSLHAPQCETLLRAGKHVLCEKPITTCPGDLEELQALARAKGLAYVEAIMYLHTPARQSVKAILPELGGITSAHFDFSQLSSRYDELAAGGAPSVFSAAMGGGALNDLGIYCAYPALDLFGPPLDIQAQAHILPSAGADGAGAALLRYPGFTLTLTWSKLGQSRGVSQVMGTRGTLSVRSVSQFQGVTFHPREGGPRELAAPLRKHEVMRYEARAFREYILGRPAAVPYGEASGLALAVARAMEAIRKSCKDG